MSSTISVQYSYLQAALLVLVIYHVGEFFLKWEGFYSFVQKYICILFFSNIMDVGSI